MANAPTRLTILAVAGLVAGGGLHARPARAEVIELLDKTKMNGKVVH